MAGRVRVEDDKEGEGALEGGREQEGVEKQYQHIMVADIVVKEKRFDSAQIRAAFDS